MRRKEQPSKRGYGNIYTPHAGSMIIEVQRESGLANRTIVLSERKVRLLRILSSRLGLTLAVAVAGSWIYFAIQAIRVPLLSQQLATMERDARRLDTLETTLAQLQQRYQQVTRMLGATPVSFSAMLSPTDSTRFTVPAHWPLAEGYITRGSGGATDYNAPHPGVDIAVPVGTEIRAAGGGLVVEVSDNVDYGKFLRIRHADRYETLYGHTSRILVREGDIVEPGQVIAHSGNTGRSTAPHLHFEVRRAGKAVDPVQLIQKR